MSPREGERVLAPRRVLVVGAGGIGSSVAFALSRAGHDVSVLARGTRLAQLERDGAVVTRAGARAPVRPVATIDSGEPYEFALSTVLFAQIPSVLDALCASRADAVYFMCNAVRGLDALRDAVGRERFGWVFPAIVASVDQEGRLASRVVPRAFAFAQCTTVGALASYSPRTIAQVADLFERAGIPTVVYPDMEGWLRAHAALMAPLMVAGACAHVRRRGLTQGEAQLLAEAILEGLARVRAAGHALYPPGVALLARAPRAAVARVLWALSRSPAIGALGARGPGEALALLEAQRDEAPTASRTLDAVCALARGAIDDTAHATTR